VNMVNLFVKVCDLELCFDIDLVFDVGSDLVFRCLPVLRDQDETG